MGWPEVLLILGGVTAGIINAMAGGGSLLTVPLLVLAGVPGGSANGSNRVGVLSSTITSVWSFRREGVSGIRASIPLIAPVIVGAIVGAVGITQLTDETFERIFGLLMIPLLLMVFIRPPKAPSVQWSRRTLVVVFFGVGLYSGAIQAGVGLIIVAVLERSGLDLVRANSIKVVLVFCTTLVALPIFILNGQVDWKPALILAVGTGVGGAIGARMAVRGGERLIRPVLVIAVVALAGRMLGLYG
ncbi:MAG: sulfite exporter TauE/SafE family protein [Acidobacteria bacterium]|nr:sulfite exporter TauE/SafE family protein [Acidobacteriota bacterium]